MSNVDALLQLCGSSLLCTDTEQTDGAEGVLLYLEDSRRVQKVLWRQLWVLDSMMSLLEGLDSAQQLLTPPCPPQPDGRARGRWKALKAQSSVCVEETEALLRALQGRVEQIHTRRHTLTQLVQQLHSKKLLSQELQDSLQKAQNALRVCNHQLTELRAESEAACHRLGSSQRIRDTLQDQVSAVQNAMQIKLLSFSQSEMSIELRPRPLSRDLEPLQLSVSWSSDHLFRLQVSQASSGLVEECLSGRCCELSAALLEVMQTYVGQAGLLTELQTLRSSFAIDWRPAQRLLVYLKSASLVCHLEVEDGYPSRGRASLLSVLRDGLTEDITPLQLQKSDPSLTEWLVFLCSSPLV